MREQMAEAPGAGGAGSRAELPIRDSLEVWSVPLHIRSIWKPYFFFKREQEILPREERGILTKVRQATAWDEEASPWGHL